jgi:hypothetical protein
MRGYHRAAFGHLGFSEHEGEHGNVEIHFRYAQYFPGLAGRPAEKLFENLARDG